MPQILEIWIFTNYIYNHPAPEVIFHLTEIAPRGRSCLLESDIQAATWTIILTLRLAK